MQLLIQGVRESHRQLRCLSGRLQLEGLTESFSRLFKARSRCSIPLPFFIFNKKQLHLHAAAHSGGKGIEPLPKVLETPIIPVDQPPIIKTRFAFLQIEIFIFCSFKTSHRIAYLTNYPNFLEKLTTY